MRLTLNNKCKMPKHSKPQANQTITVYHTLTTTSMLIQIVCTKSFQATDFLISFVLCFHAHEEDYLSKFDKW